MYKKILSVVILSFIVFGSVSANDIPWSAAQMGSNNPVNAQCGLSNGQSLSFSPTTGLCSSGISSIVSGSGPWTWVCSGVNGGSSVLCKAEKNATPGCGLAARNYSYLDNDFVGSFCIVGNPVSLPSFPASGATVTWDCPDSKFSWIYRNGTTDNRWSSVTYGNGLFVAVGDGANRVMTSTDGMNWIPGHAPEGEWISVAYGNGLFVAVSTKGEYRAMTSPDGINWTLRKTPSGRWISVVYGNGLFVAVGFAALDVVMTSPDGTNWIARDFKANAQWSSITYGKGRFVAVASTGTEQIGTSIDGINWIAIKAPENNIWNSVTYGNGLFVAVSTYGVNRLMTSPDGINWTARPLPVNSRWLSVAYGNGLFVAVGDAGNKTIISSDGINWIEVTKGEENWWLSVAYGNGVFVSVGINGPYRVMTASMQSISCQASRSAVILDGQCGSSNGQSLSSAPTTGLCNSGTASIVSGSGPWTWVCSGVNGGTSASCRAEVSSTACNWACSNWGACVNGTQTRTCTSSPSGCTGVNPYPITQPCSIGNGFCGTAHGGAFETKPITGLCNNADMIAIGGSGPWYWICKDRNSDDAELCSATKKIIKVDGVCGSSHRGSYASAPATGLCSLGTASPVYGNGPWVWLCNGNNGGSFAVCFALKSAVNLCVFEGKSISVNPDGFNQKCCDGLVLCPPVKGVVGIMGTCKKSCEVVCNDIYAPVCGEDNKTYSNECYATVAGIGVAYQGQCLSINTSGCGKANGTNTAIAPMKDLCGDGTLPKVRTNERGDWAWKCGDELCSASDPNKEYKKTFGAIEMSSYSGLATSPDKAVLAIENFHCNWLPSGGVYRDYKKVSCKYESVGSHGACENCSVVVFTIEKK